MKYFSVLILSMCLVTSTGCGNNGTPADQAAAHKAQVVLVRVAAQGGAAIGLKVWAKDHPAEAKEAATALSKNVSETVMPYLLGQAGLSTSAEVQAFINSSLFTNVDPILKTALVTAAALLDTLLPVPSADKLSPAAKDFLVAFVAGAAAGCDDFLRTPAAAPTRGSNWIK